MTQECAEYRALYEKIVLPPDVGPRVDWARVLEQKQVSAVPRVGDTSRSSKSHLAPSDNRTGLCVVKGPVGALAPVGGSGKGESRGDSAGRGGFLQEGAYEEASERWEGRIRLWVKW